MSDLKGNRVAVTAPPPPDRCVLELSEAQAEVLAALCVELTYATDRESPFYTFFAELHARLAGAGFSSTGDIIVGFQKLSFEKPRGTFRDFTGE